MLEMEAEEEEEERADVQRERSEGTGCGVCAALLTPAIQVRSYLLRIPTLTRVSCPGYQTFVRPNRLGDVVAHLEDEWAQRRPRIPSKKRTRLG